VSAANTDLANSDALQMAQLVDAEGARTIGERLRPYRSGYKVVIQSDCAVVRAAAAAAVLLLAASGCDECSGNEHNGGNCS
jgi:hypothetical protein